MTAVYLIILGGLLLFILIDIKASVLWEIWVASRGYDAIEQVEEGHSKNAKSYQISRRSEYKQKHRILRND
ncbi:hypothetical protein [Tumebacillus lipolyticus]|uniref:Uncharacterized protein n=1 Tax=Tumebacillus lipolyticus TaxID=1280370 RepID=A0ABW4ZZ91_9BACL